MFELKNLQKRENIPEKEKENNLNLFHKVFKKIMCEKKPLKIKNLAPIDLNFFKITKSFQTSFQTSFFFFSKLLFEYFLIF